MSQGFHRISHKKYTTKHSSAGKFFDKSMYILPLLAPIMTLPQLLDVWQNHQKAHVSILTWGAYTLLSAIWVYYGFLHKEKQLILVNFLLLLIDGAIVVGLLLTH